MTKQQWAPSGGNWGWYSDQEVEDLAAEAMRTFDDEARDILITKIHEIANRDAVIVDRRRLAHALAGKRDRIIPIGPCLGRGARRRSCQR